MGRTCGVSYKSKLFYLKVAWKMPNGGRVVCNTDRASRGNSELSASGFCVRNSNGNLKYAEALCLEISTNLHAKIMAITYCMD